MRKMMTKEVTHTTIKVAKMVNEGGMPKALQLPDEKVLGNVSMEKAQSLMKKKLGTDITVFGVQANTVVYEMPVEQFIQHATIKAAEEAEEQE
jgi:hypothetical protein